MHFQDIGRRADLLVHDFRRRVISLMKSLPALPDGNLKRFLRQYTIFSYIKFKSRENWPDVFSPHTKILSSTLLLVILSCGIVDVVNRIDSDGTIVSDDKGDSTVSAPWDLLVWTLRPLCVSKDRLHKRQSNAMILRLDYTSRCWSINAECGFTLTENHHKKISKSSKFLNTITLKALTKVQMS